MTLEYSFMQSMIRLVLTYIFAWVTDFKEQNLCVLGWLNPYSSIQWIPIPITRTHMLNSTVPGKSKILQLRTILFIYSPHKVAKRFSD